MNKATQGQFRNGALNIGLYCGFATNLPDGTLHVQQGASRAYGMTFQRGEGARSAETPYELVVVVFQIEPPHPQVALTDKSQIPNELFTGEQAILRALHVCKMPKRLAPKSFKWMIPTQVVDTEFYPCLHYGRLSPQIMDSLPDDFDYPDWLNQVIEADQEVAAILTQRQSGISFQNRFLISGYLRKQYRPQTGEYGNNSDSTVCRMLQPGDTTGLQVTLLDGLPGSGTILSGRYMAGGMPATMLGTLIKLAGHDKTQDAFVPYFHAKVLDLMAVTNLDVAPGEAGTALVAASDKMDRALEARSH